MVQTKNYFCEIIAVLPPELQMGNFNKRLMLGFRRTVCCMVTDGGGIAAVVANSFEWSITKPTRFFFTLGSDTSERQIVPTLVYHNTNVYALSSEQKNVVKNVRKTPF